MCSSWTHRRQQRSPGCAPPSWPPARPRHSTTLFFAGGPTAVAALLGVGDAVQAAPSVWTAYRTRVPSGIAPLAWPLIGVEGLLWGVDAWQHDDPAMLSFAAISIVAASAIVLRVHTTRHRLAA